jgi:hypothetical protein
MCIQNSRPQVCGAPPTDLICFAKAIKAAVAGDAGALLSRELALEMVAPQVAASGSG